MDDETLGTIGELGAAAVVAVGSMTAAMTVCDWRDRIRDERKRKEDEAKCPCP